MKTWSYIHVWKNLFCHLSMGTLYNVWLKLAKWFWICWMYEKLTTTLMTKCLRWGIHDWIKAKFLYCFYIALYSFNTCSCLYFNELEYAAIAHIWSAVLLACKMSLWSLKNYRYVDVQVKIPQTVHTVLTAIATLNPIQSNNIKVHYVIFTVSIPYMEDN